jgi:hypothetical protein
MPAHRAGLLHVLTFDRHMVEAAAQAGLNLIEL